MYSPRQLRMMLPSFALQKMSGQGIRTHPPKPLLVWQSSILISLGHFFRNAYLFLWLGRWGPFIVLGALSLWRWEDFDFCGHDGTQRVIEPSLSCRRLTKIVGGMICCHLVFSLYRRRRTGRGRSPKKTQERPIKYAFGEMSNDCPRNMVRNPVWDDNY